MWLFLHADYYMTDRLTKNDAYYKFHLNLHRYHHNQDMTKQQIHKQHSEKTGHYMCVYAHGCKLL